jgi:hypothetical protein
VHEPKAKRPAKVIADVRADLADAAALAVTDYGDVMDMPDKFRADRAVDWNRPERRPHKKVVHKKSSASALHSKASASKSTASKSKSLKSSATKAKASSSKTKKTS